MLICAPTETFQITPNLRTFARDVFANGGFDVLYRFNAKIYGSKTVLLEGEIRKRKSNGLCGYLSLDQTDDEERAKKRREMIAAWIKDNPNATIGKHSVIDHIKYDIGQSTTSEAYYNHHMGISPFKNTAHREHQWLSPLEIIVDCTLTNCSVCVCVHVKGKDYGSLFQPIWSFGEINENTRYMVFNGSHYDNVVGKTSITQIETGMNFLEHNEDGDSNRSYYSNIGGDNGEQVHEILTAMIVRMVLLTKTLIAKRMIVIIHFYLLQISVGVKMKSSPPSYLAEQWWLFSMKTLMWVRRR